MTDAVALLPALVAAATAVAVLLTDLFLPGRRTAVVAVTVLGCLATGGVAVALASGTVRVAFCSAGAGCSFVADPLAGVIAAVFAALTAGAVGLSWPVVRRGVVPAGEYLFLVSCSLTGGVVLGAARDLVSLIVAVETLTLPLYVLVGLRRRAPASAEAAVTFFLVSVISTAVALLGAALLYAATGALHFARLGAALGGVPATRAPLVTVGVVLLIAGLAFKVAAVPLHAWAPPTYDGAPLPVAAYLSTASKLGGVVAITVLVAGPLRAASTVTGSLLAALAVLTMTVGNLVALRQQRMVRLLAWSSVAQSGYILAALVVPSGRGAALGYTVFYVVLELTAFAAVVALRGTGDGGAIAAYRGTIGRSPWVGAGLVIALTGLAGLPPGLAGLFAKVTIVRALVGGGAGWLAVVVAVNAVIGLAYYLRVAVVLFAPAPASSSSPVPELAAVAAPAPAAVAPGVAVAVTPTVAPTVADGPAVTPVALAAPVLGSSDSLAADDETAGVAWSVRVVLLVAVAVAVVIGFAPQLVLGATQASLVIR